MHENVWEWCQDRYAPYGANEQIDLIQLTEQSDQNRVVRGGGWLGVPGDCRSAFRGRFGPGNRNFGFGFRCSFRLD